MFASLRAAVLENFHHVEDIGPCGAIAVALERLGLGRVASVSVSGVYESGPHAGIVDTEMPHYVVVDNQGQILDVALPPGFRAAKYNDLELYEFGDTPADQLWTAADFSFWQAVLSKALAVR